MSAFFFVIFIGIAWMGLSGDIGVFTFVIGILLGLGMWRFFGFKSRRPASFARTIRLTYLGVSLFIIFLKELLLANLQQLRIILAPQVRVSPYWLQYRTELETPAMRAVLGSMIVMTPGTVAYEEIETEDGAWTIAVHALHAGNKEQAQQTLDHIRDSFESRLRQMETL